MRRFNSNYPVSRTDPEAQGIFWCRTCNVPLLEHTCGVCGSTHPVQMTLSPPGDVRFCSQYERSLLNELIMRDFGVSPSGERVILMNRIPGEDKTDEVIVDGLHLGLLRFSLRDLSWHFELSIDGAKILAACGRKTVRLRQPKGHLGGKTVSGGEVLAATDDIGKGDSVIVIAGELTGYGVAYANGRDMGSSASALKVRKIDSSTAEMLPPSDMDMVIRANAPHMKRIVKDAVNVIRGMANQKEFREHPVYVSFSGGKDSLTVLDLAKRAVKGVKVFFGNTGIEFPETVKFAREYCAGSGIELLEADAGDAFWKNLPAFGPPAKDFRWCCKVCKLAPISALAEKAGRESGKFLTIDGKRKYESFARARIAPKEENPFVPGQVNVFPIRDWRAIEVWLYIHFRKLRYNPLYDMGFERVGCWLCPAELQAEYHRFRDLHPELYERWEGYLAEWAERHGLQREYIRHGFWRWKSLPPKMRRLAEELGIKTVPAAAPAAERGEGFGISMTSGISPCVRGGFSIEGAVRGVLPQDAAGVMKVLGDTMFSEELGVLHISVNAGSVNFFTNGALVINAPSEQEAQRLFGLAAGQLARAAKCTKCSVCVRACPVDAITIDGGIHVSDACTRCGKCTQACVVAKYGVK